MKPAAAPADTYTDGFFVDEVSDLCPIFQHERREKGRELEKNKIKVGIRAPINYLDHVHATVPFAGQPLVPACMYARRTPFDICIKAL